MAQTAFRSSLSHEERQSLTTTKQNSIRSKALTFCGLAVGGYCAYAAFRFNAAMAEGADGYVFAVVMASLTVGTWLLLPLARERWAEGARFESLLWGSAWFVALALVLANSAGFTAGGRKDAVSSKATAIAAYDRADKDFKRASADLEMLKASPRWEKTAGCSTNLQPDASKALCNQVARDQRDIRTAEATLALGRPGSSDAQAEVLARVTGLKIETVSTILPIATTLVLELMANVFMFAAATTGKRSREMEAEPMPTPIIEIKPAKTGRRAVRKLDDRMPRGGALTLVREYMAANGGQAVPHAQIIRNIKDTKGIRLKETSLRRALERLQDEGAVEQMPDTRAWRAVKRLRSVG